MKTLSQMSALVVLGIVLGASVPLFAAAGTPGVLGAGASSGNSDATQNEPAPPSGTGPTTPSATPEGDWLPVSEIAQRLEQQGYRIEEIERYKDYYEAYVSDGRGVEWELEIDPRTGKILDKDAD